jgi:hypothetical protein
LFKCVNFGCSGLGVLDFTSLVDLVVWKVNYLFEGICVFIQLRISQLIIILLRVYLLDLFGLFDLGLWSLW